MIFGEIMCRRTLGEERERHSTSPVAVTATRSIGLMSCLFSDLAWHAATSSKGISFYAQAEQVVPEIGSLEDFVRVLPSISEDTWRKIVSKFVDDLDNIIGRMPATKSDLKLYRGTEGVKAKVSSRDPSVPERGPGEAFRREAVLHAARPCKRGRPRNPSDVRVAISRGARSSSPEEG